ncbi:MAG: ChaN family lipoprotein, partial [Nannocystaceae bacterium]
PWGNYRTDYRPLVETAKSRGMPVVAANTPRSALRKAARGPSGYAEVRQAHPQWLPERLYPARDSYWARVDRTIRGHGPPPDGDRTYSVQNLWDNTMADSVVRATEEHPDRAVLHVVGAFHIEQHDGTTAQIRRRAPTLDVVTVTVVPTHDLARAAPDPERADFVVYADAYAEGPSGDRLAVTVPGSLGYRLHLPEGPPPEGGWPLLVWLADDEGRPEDEVLRWRMALGDRAAFAVVEPPHRTRAREGWLVRRWSWPQSQAQDFSVAALGLHRLVDYARRRLPVREDGVVIAGEGAGGTVALWSAQYGDDAPGIEVLALAPDLPRALSTASIPERSSAVAGVTVLGELDDGTEAGLRGAGLEPSRGEAPAPGLPADAAVLEALGLSGERSAAAAPPSPDVAAPMAVAGSPLRVHVAGPSVVARRWGALYTALLKSRGHDASLVLGPIPTKGPPVLAFDGDPAAHAALLQGAFAEGRGLPGSPDPFGGAVVILLPESRDSDRHAAAWAEILAKTEAAQGFFKTPYRAVVEGSPQLATTLQHLREQGRTEVLIVPAGLCANATRMQRAVDAVEPHGDGLTLHWLPGLGHHVVAHLAGQ